MGAGADHHRRDRRGIARQHFLPHPHAGCGIRAEVGNRGSAWPRPWGRAAADLLPLEQVRQEGCGGIKKAAISGYYGFGNIGDEAVLAGIIASFAERCPETELVALSADPAGTEALHNIRAINRMNPAEVLAVLWKADLLISGGGSLLQDVTSSRSLLYYLAVIWLAKRLGKKVMVYAQGVGPISGNRSRRLASSILNTVDLITIRDGLSRDYLRDLGVTAPEVRVTADPSFAVTPASEERAFELLRAAGVVPNVPLIGVSIRPWKDDPSWLSPVAQGLDAAALRLGAALVFLPMQRDQDLNICLQVASRMTSSSTVVAQHMTPMEAIAVAGKMDFVVGMRLHSLIFAAARGVPFVGLAYDPKVDAFVREVAREEPLGLEKIASSFVTSKIVSAWERRYELSTLVAAEARTLRAAAASNAELACELLNKL
ncbi:MAG: polysaccharide pyruvyl transferase CsaB [Armatimonadetes bacterium]|nr:polysaccharide pyruvyl transferase CsaB [Armatimonadota bacterium]